MPDPNFQPSLISYFKEIYRRLNKLEGRGGINRAEISSTGTVDPTTNIAEDRLHVQFGDLYYDLDAVDVYADPYHGNTKAYGVGVAANIQGSASQELNHLRVENTGGVVFPQISHMWNDPALNKAVTSSSFANIWQAVPMLISGDNFEFLLPITCDAATTGEVRIMNINSPVTQIGPTLPVGAGANANTWFQGIHSGTLRTGPWVYSVEARRLTGTGGVNIYQPTGFCVGGHIVKSGDPGFSAGGRWLNLNGQPITSI